MSIINRWSKKKNYNIIANYHLQNKWNQKYFTILKAIIFNFFIFIFIKLFVKNKNSNLDEKKIVLIDCFATRESINFERSYNGLYEVLNKRNIKNVFFVPTFVIERNLFNILKIIELIPKKVSLFKEHNLKLRDLIFSFFHFIRIKKFIKKYKLYNQWDLSEIICDEVKSANDYYSKIISILNYRFAKNLAKKNLKIKKTINWFENQTVDKGWNLGFRRFFNNIDTYGYQGFLNYPHFMHSFPTTSEEKAKVIPKKIIITGKAYVNAKKEFFPKLKVFVGPAFNYKEIFKNYYVKKQNVVLLVLTGIMSIDLQLLHWISSLDKKKFKMKILIKPHPILPINKIINYNKDQHINLNNFVISRDKISSLFKKSKVVICCGPTSATIESLAYNCFLLIPLLEPSDAISLDYLKIAKKNFSIASDRNDFIKKMNSVIKKYKEKKKIDLKKLLFEKVNDNNLKYFL